MPTAWGLWGENRMALAPVPMEARVHLVAEEEEAMEA